MGKANFKIKFSQDSIEIANRWFNPNFSLNKEFQNKKLKENERYFDEVEKFPLNDSQRKAVILDEQRNLVIAGAGTGKTSTLVAKIGYILKNNLALPHEILVLAFNSDAKNEINKRIGKYLTKDEEDPEIEAKTFHGFGLEVIGTVEKKKPITNRWSDKDKKNEYTDFLKNELDHLFKNSPLKSNIIKLLTWELTPYPINKELDFNTMSEYRSFIKEFDLIALNGNQVKSYGELLIANYLFTQGIPFTYEDKYQSATQKWPSFQYYPDFHIKNTNLYIEYFGTDRLGKTLKFIDAEKYNKEIRSKKACHANYGTELIDLYYYNLQEKNLLSKLEEELDKHKVTRSPLSDEEILKAFKEQNYTTRLIELFKRFRTLFKSDNHNFNELKNIATNDNRSQILLTIFHRLFESYEKELQKDKAIDFIDMVNGGIKYISLGKYQSHFKYILVDEYQDLSPQRYRLINELLKKNPKTKLYAVGDDWQCIYGFTGSDIKFTTQFSKYYGSLARFSLSHTYRFNQSLCDLASEVISKNENQIKKNVNATNQSFEKACFIHRYQFNGRNALLDLVKELSKKKKSEQSLLILGRNNSDIPKEKDKSHIKEMWKNDQVTFRTCHSAKGLEADYVILHKLQEQFPSKREEDPIIKLILNENSSSKVEEERRLLYVSITRAKQEIHITTDIKSQSQFINEILESDNHVKIIDYMNKDPKKCGRCNDSELFQYDYYNYQDKRKYTYSCNTCDYESFQCPECKKGQSLITKENDQLFFECEQKCGFKHQVCDSCHTGYLRQLPGKDFISCTGYFDFGCRNTISLKK
ncbi:MAG: UvrD-helicase domain-containing protein [Bacteriovoracaceae bacterium]|nr:UvrD-helicase domain-containing protein [Bacteriovoracaceae bacterium]